MYIDKRFAFSERTDSDKWIDNNLKKIERIVNEADAGIWEFRNMSQVHCYTNLFHWAGASAANKIASYIGNEEIRERALNLRDQETAKDRTTVVEGKSVSVGIRNGGRRSMTNKEK